MLTCYVGDLISGWVDDILCEVPRVVTIDYRPAHGGIVHKSFHGHNDSLISYLVRDIRGCGYREVNPSDRDGPVCIVGCRVHTESVLGNGNVVHKYWGVCKH